MIAIGISLPSEDLRERVAVTHLAVPVIVASGRHRLRDDELPGDAVFMPKPYALDVIVSKLSELIERTRRKMVG